VYGAFLRHERHKQANHHRSTSCNTVLIYSGYCCNPVTCVKCRQTQRSILQLCRFWRVINRAAALFFNAMLHLYQRQSPLWSSGRALQVGPFFRTVVKATIKLDWIEEWCGWGH
jgi:hypothetical protein